MVDEITTRWANWRHRAADPASEAGRIFTQRLVDSASVEVFAANRRRQEGLSLGPLDGAFISVKDLFNVAGAVTTAGSAVLRNDPPATADAPVIACLRTAGAVIVGKTAMTEFAYSGVGWNPHYGTPTNPFDRAIGRIPGGSSSGAAVSVSDGFADIGLGTDTGGSVRIPAALCGLVGWKPTAGRIDRRGMVPLSPSLDAIGIIARTVRQCIEVDGVISASPFGFGEAPLPKSLRLGIVRGLAMSELEPEVAGAYADAIATFKAAGVKLVEFDTSEVDELARQGVGARIVSYEAYAYHRERLEAAWPMFDPRVLRRIQSGAEVNSDAYRAALAARTAAIANTKSALGSLQGWLMPTVPIVAPPLSVCDSDEEFFRTNSLLLRNTALVNLLDGCAISLPCPIAQGQLPVGISLAGLAHSDHEVLAVAATLEALLRKACNPVENVS